MFHVFLSTLFHSFTNSGTEKLLFFLFFSFLLLGAMHEEHSFKEAGLSKIESC